MVRHISKKEILIDKIKRLIKRIKCNHKGYYEIDGTLYGGEVYVRCSNCGKVKKI